MTSLAVACQVDMLDSSDLSYEGLLNFADLVTRTVRNALMSPLSRLFYIVTIDLYPAILTGEKTAVQPWKIRQAVGWAAKDSATQFLRDMSLAGAWEYDPGKYNKEEELRIGYITANVDVLPYPESIDLKTIDKKRRAKAAEDKKAKQFKNPIQLFQCEECGSNELVYDATARCKTCGHIHAPILDIPAANITIDAEIIEIADDPDVWDDSPTIQVKAIQQQQLPETPRPARDTIGLARPDEPCIKCGRPRRECFENSEGTWWFTCTPSMQAEYERRRN